MTAEDPMPHADAANGGTPHQARSATATPPRTRRRRPGILTMTGLLLLAVGLGTLGWIGYEYFGTNAPSEDAARSEVSQLEKDWNASSGPDSSAPSTAASASPGATSSASASSGPMYTQAQLDKAMAILTIPRFGPDYKVPIIVGTSDYALARGVGWYQTTQQPGQIGNFAIAGHRITHGQPFARLLELQPGDKVIVETKTYIFTYQIDESPATLTVQDVDTWVLDPVPGKPGVTPTQALITLTTCQDLFRSPDRSVGFGHLVQTTKK